MGGNFFPCPVLRTHWNSLNPRLCVSLVGSVVPQALHCPAGKEYRPCVSTCTSRTCQNREYYEETTCSYIREECVCRSGTILHRADSPYCVTEEQCGKCVCVYVCARVSPSSSVVMVRVSAWALIVRRPAAAFECVFPLAFYLVPLPRCYTCLSLFGSLWVLGSAPRRSPLSGPGARTTR